ncbi:P-loop NTPase family protein [Pyrococcus yayanosii]|uniref:Type II secretion system protein, putative n=1 Tax=Pyrococcus yayanosii (strain CH1 / JCM 16557) TaxID=529709 RepID=F8AF05_PYRYC|nr:Flp pilus assembly complex ATPase component TadA [Pyrococcus yayanosii]AEH24842.1 type II secretion system protein, putative [Pyrococcus yayanosii CH1]
MGIYIFRPEDLLRYGTIREEQLKVLEEAVKGRSDILIVGGTRAGKTKLVEALTFLIPDDWRIAVITAYGEFKPFKENIEVIDTRFDGRRLEERTQDVVEKLREIEPDYVIVDTLHTVSVPEILRALIDNYAFIITSLVIARNLVEEVKHWLRMDDELLARFELIVELYRDVRTGLRKVNAIYRIKNEKGIKLEKIA